jgi:mannose-6-phosphate isomerase-like protein (cupin superfamily)
MSIAVVTLNGRYPDDGYAMNHTCNEMGYVLKGSGKLVTTKQEVILSEGDAVYIPAYEKYYWEGEMTLLLPTAPAWSLEQHEICIETVHVK